MHLATQQSEFKPPKVEMNLKTCFPISWGYAFLSRSLLSGHNLSLFLCACFAMKEGELCIRLGFILGGIWELKHAYWTALLWQFSFKLSIFHQDLDMVLSAKHLIVCFKKLYVITSQKMLLSCFRYMRTGGMNPESCMHECFDLR